MPVFTTSGRYFGGYAVDRTVFRRLLPDSKLYVYAAGLVNPGDANNATLSLRYQRDSTATFDTLGSDVFTGSGLVKFELGPFDVFATAGVPAGESIPIVRVHATKNTGTNGVLECVTIWARFLAARQ